MFGFCFGIFLDDSVVNDNVNSLTRQSRLEKAMKSEIKYLTIINLSQCVSE